MSQQVILVTGASRGIGLATVAKFKALGWKTVSCARTSGDAATGDSSKPDLFLACDVRDPAQVRACVEKTLERFGRIDALVNNAGAAGTNSMDANGNDELWHRIIDTNLHGTYYFSKQVLPHLPDGTGRIVNVASILALRGVPDQTAYTAAKHAILGFTRALSHLAAPRKISVNCVCPGWTRTAMAEQRMTELGLTRQQLDASVPVGRIAEPREVADLIAMLVISEASAQMTGQAISIDGGVTA